MTMMKTKKLCDPALIIVAAGSSTRMGGTKKEYLPLNGGTVLSSAAKVFLETFHFSAILITCPLKESEELQNIEFSRAKEAFFKDPSVKKLVENTKINFIPGGKSRQESVYKALCALKTVFYTYGIFNWTQDNYSLYYFIMLTILYQIIIMPLIQLTEFFYELIFEITDNQGIAVIGLSFVVTLFTLPLIAGVNCPDA